MYGEAKAAELWYQYRLSVPVDLRRLVEVLGLEVVTFPFQGRIKEMVVDRFIGVRPGLTRPWFRWYVSHAIGHHMLHVGTSFYLESWQWVTHARAERQAEEFAAWLLGGPDGSQHTASELGVPFDKLLLLQGLAGMRKQAGFGGGRQMALPMEGVGSG